MSHNKQTLKILKEPGITLDEAIKLATAKILQPGYKPEDYFLCREDMPLFIAKWIVREARHIMILDRLYKRRIVFPFPK
jgi:hypothetical protein